MVALSLRPDDAEMRLERAKLEGKASPLDTALQQFQRTRELGKDPYLVSEESARMLVRWWKKPARRRNYATSRRNGVQPKPKHGIPVQYSIPNSTWEKNKL